MCESTCGITHTYHSNLQQDRWQCVAHTTEGRVTSMMKWFPSKKEAKDYTDMLISLTGAGNDAEEEIDTGDSSANTNREGRPKTMFVAAPALYCQQYYYTPTT